nr:hypothetical protein BaRGS_034575 [Batillaria attramentaria]
MLSWQDIVKSLYPNLLTHTYCVPPFYMNRVQYSRQIVGGEPLNFNNYLNKIDPALAQLFPKPSDMPDEYHRGDFDVLIIHRKYGALIAQLDLLSRGPDAVCLAGPPGTGKSLVLVVKGLISARDSGYYVIVLSTSPFSLAVSKLIHHQLTLTLEKNDNTASLANKVELLVHDLRQDPESVEEIVKELEGRQGKLCVLMDEAIFNESPVCTASHNLVRALKRRLANRLCLWAACLSNANIPEELQVETLTESLRCAPSVCRQVEMGLARISDVDRYTTVSTPPAYGPDVIRLRHQGTEHNTEWPVDCVACGEKIAEVLKKLLHESESELQAALNAPSPLQYRDVLVLTRSADLHETTTDENNQEKTRASGVVRGLRSQDIPVGVLGWRRDDVDRWQKELDDLAVAKIDKVTVARWRAVDGLERKVVVYLPGRDTGVDGHQTLEEVDADDRLRLVSRASTQLIMVDVPRAS